jgi:triphosphoribosyl-dephospho-CoA synthetase
MSILANSSYKLFSTDELAVINLKEKVRDRLLSRELQCAIERVTHKLDLYDTYGVPIEELEAARSLRKLQDSLEHALSCFEGGSA